MDYVGKKLINMRRENMLEAFPELVVVERSVESKGKAVVDDFIANVD